MGLGLRLRATGWLTPACRKRRDFASFSRTLSGIWPYEIILMSECACEASQMVAIVPPNDRLKSTEPSFGAVRIATPFWKARPCGSLDFIGPNARKGPAEAGEIPPLPACWGKPTGCS